MGRNIIDMYIALPVDIGTFEIRLRKSTQPKAWALSHRTALQDMIVHPDRVRRQVGTKSIEIRTCRKWSVTRCWHRLRMRVDTHRIDMYIALLVDVNTFGILGWRLVYAVFEIIGAVLAVGLFYAVRPEESSDADPPREPALYSKLVAEFVGTFMLVLTVGLHDLGKSKVGAFSIAASLMCMIYALGDVSGAHFNPAVTLAITLRGKLDHAIFES